MQPLGFSALDLKAASSPAMVNTTSQIRSCDDDVASVLLTYDNKV